MDKETIDIRQLESKLKSTKSDKARLKIYEKLANAYRKKQPEKANHYWQEALSIAKDEGNQISIGEIYFKIAKFHYLSESYDNTIHYLLESNKVFEEIEYQPGLASNFMQLGNTYQMIHRFSHSIKQFRKAHQIFRKLGNQRQVVNAEFCLGNAHNWNEQLDKASRFLKSALKASKEFEFREIEMRSTASLAILYTKLREFETAEAHFNQALALINLSEEPMLRIQIKKSLGNLYNESQQYDKAIEVLHEALHEAEQEEPQTSLVLIHEFLADSYEKKGDHTNALKHFKAYNDLHKKKLNEENIHRIAIIENEYKTQTLAKEAEIHRLKNVELTHAYEELQAAQQQLITHERLALLGQLTSGIAHEIQNPLNFVKNFAEVSAEMIRELVASKFFEKTLYSKEEIQNLITMLDSLQNNNEKIRNHGMRASNIVKSMLLHAREKFSEKQRIKINALVSESIDLATQGLQPSDHKKEILITKSFFEPDQEIDLYPNNMGRVILNIMNNAFYAINEKVQKDGNSYKPELKISTKKQKNFFDIIIKNNGILIPDEIKGQVFKPFFTTKANGEGTGLGLSISQDIVSKEHGGQLVLSEDEDGFTTFIVRLPHQSIL